MTDSTPERDPVSQLIGGEDKAIQKFSQSATDFVGSVKGVEPEELIPAIGSHGEDENDSAGERSSAIGMIGQQGKGEVPSTAKTDTGNGPVLEGAAASRSAKALTGPHDMNMMKMELDDIGQYSYAALCAYSLQSLYEGSQCDRGFADEWIKRLVQHLGKEGPFLQTMQALALQDVRLENGDPFVDELKQQKLLVANGSSVIPRDLMALAVTDGSYDSRMRVLIKYISLLLKVDWAQMEAYEETIVQSLKDEEHNMTEEELKEQESMSKKRKIKRFAMIGAAAIGGGALLGLTGGLAAPLLAAGAGVFIGGAGAAALGSVAGVAIIGSLFGVAGLGLGGYKMKKRVGGIEEFEFEPLTEGRHLHVTIAVTGWITEDKPDFRTVWQGLANSREQYVLRYESKYLKEMGKAMDYLVSIAINAATQEALKYTILSGLLAAIAWPATLLSAASIIDNPWSVCAHRAVNAGRQLAEVLLSRQQGKRPVTLVGFSLGARVIFYCLLEMAGRKNCEGIIEDVVLLGAPVTGNPTEWRKLARVVAGRVVNGYCRGDWLLKFLYRTASIQISIAGLKPVGWVNRRMHNIDLSDVVTGHMDYMNKIDEILSVVGINTREHAMQGGAGSLKQWVNIHKSNTMEKVKVAETETVDKDNAINDLREVMQAAQGDTADKVKVKVVIKSSSTEIRSEGVHEEKGGESDLELHKVEATGGLCSVPGVDVKTLNSDLTLRTSESLSQEDAELRVSIAGLDVKEEQHTGTCAVDSPSHSSGGGPPGPHQVTMATSERPIGDDDDDQHHSPLVSEKSRLHTGDRQTAPLTLHPVLNPSSPVISPDSGVGFDDME